jgi:hypothetical protein
MSALKVSAMDATRRFIQVQHSANELFDLMKQRINSGEGAVRVFQEFIGVVDSHFGSYSHNIKRVITLKGLRQATAEARLYAKKLVTPPTYTQEDIQQHEAKRVEVYETVFTKTNSSEIADAYTNAYMPIYIQTNSQNFASEIASAYLNILSETGNNEHAKSQAMIQTERFIQEADQQSAQLFEELRRQHDTDEEYDNSVIQTSITGKQIIEHDLNLVNELTNPRIILNDRECIGLLDSNTDLQTYYSIKYGATPIQEFILDGVYNIITTEFQIFLFKKLLNNFMNLTLLCSNINQIICTITIVAHGSKTMDQTEYRYSCIKPVNTVIKLNVNPLGCYGEANAEQRKMLATLLSSLLKTINFPITHPHMTLYELIDHIRRNVKDQEELKRYLEESKGKICTGYLSSLCLEKDGFNAKSIITFEQCEIGTIDSTYNPKVHISNKSYGLTDNETSNKNAFIFINLYYINSDGIMLRLCEELQLIFNKSGIVIDESNFDIFYKVYLSDILKPIYVYLRYILKFVYGCDDLIINSLITLMIILIFDASCNGDSSSIGSDGTKIYGGKTTNKKRKAKSKKQKTKKEKRKNKKTKKRKTRKQKY